MCTVTIIITFQLSYPIDKMLLIASLLCLLISASCSSIIQSADDSETEVQCIGHNFDDGLSAMLPEKIFDYALTFRKECLSTNDRTIKKDVVTFIS